MIRLVLSVALAAALLAAVGPGLDGARAAQSGDRLDRDVDALVGAATGLASEDATRRSVPGARRTVTVVVPGRAWTEAHVDFLAVGCRAADCDADAISYRVRGRATRRVHLSGVHLRTPDGAVVLTEPGRHRLRLALRSEGDGAGGRGGPVVAVRRLPAT